MTTCTQVRQQTGEALAGSAPFARLWVLLEQPGPWGRDALTESHLPVQVGQALKALAVDRPVRLGLIRSVGAHADTSGGRRTLLVAHTDASSSWIAARCIDDVESLPRQLSVDALLDAAAPPADLPGIALPTPGRALLVCTNAKRDQCCAVLGRPLAAALARDAEADVWETSHTGGHRFAPTFVSLPDGYLFGGPQAAARSLDACRGRSSLVPAAQVAELQVLQRLGATVPRPLEVRADGPATPEQSAWTVTAGDERFVVEVTRTRAADRPESCGKGPVASHVFTATIR
ncbi:MAG: sucrase ferredoxin [Actinomycetes bacterium]